MLGCVVRYFGKKRLTHFGKSFVPWLNVFSVCSANRSKVLWKTSFFEDETTETKALERRFMVFVCLWLCLCLRLCSLRSAQPGLGPRFLLVFQNVTCLHWKLAVYSGNCSPCPNLLLPACVSRRRPCLTLHSSLARTLRSADTANKLSTTTKWIPVQTNSASSCSNLLRSVFSQNITEHKS